VNPATLFLCGDVMTGRGIDQILASPNAPCIQEPYVCDARDYIALAEQANGPVPHPAGDAYIWGDALDELQRVAPDARVINLETSITTSDTHWRGKGIHYRMHPKNIGCITAVRPDVCVLANNHVLDYGYAGLEETLETLAAAHVKTTGAGCDLTESQRPATIDLAARRRIVIFSVGSETSGIPPVWAAGLDRPGVDLLSDLSDAAADDLLDRVRHVKHPRDVVVVSIHWGDNWGYEVPASHVRFAHRLLDGEVDLIHGHSSHHPRPIEIYNGKLVLYGCGDFLNDYEGIDGYEQFRDDLVLMYFPTVAPGSGVLQALRMTPMRIFRMQLIRAAPAEAEWMHERVAAISGEFGSDIDRTVDGALLLHARP